MSSLECSKPFQCAVIHELKAEFVEVKAELYNLNANVRSLLDVCTQLFCSYRNED